MDTTEVTIALDTIVVFGAKPNRCPAPRLRRSTDHLSSRISGPLPDLRHFGKGSPAARCCAGGFRPHGRRTNSAGMAHGPAQRKSCSGKASSDPIGDVRHRGAHCHHLRDPRPGSPLVAQLDHEQAQTAISKGQ